MKSNQIVAKLHQANRHETDNCMEWLLPQPITSEVPSLGIPTGVNCTVAPTAALLLMRMLHRTPCHGALPPDALI